MIHEGYKPEVGELTLLIAKMAQYIEDNDWGDGFWEIKYHLDDFLDRLGAHSNTRNFIMHVYDLIRHDEDTGGNETQKFLDSLKDSK